MRYGFLMNPTENLRWSTQTILYNRIPKLCGRLRFREGRRASD